MIAAVNLSSEGDESGITRSSYNGYYGCLPSSRRGSDSRRPHMDKPLFTILSQFAVFGLAAVLIFAVWQAADPRVEPAQLSASVGLVATTTGATAPELEADRSEAATSSSKVPDAPALPSEKSLFKATESAPARAQTTASNESDVRRIQNPYPTPPFDFETVNTRSRGALVNILCLPHSGALRPISGSGVLIDPRGVILTNAHVAQYVLLAESNRFSISCTVRTGSPARVLSMPRILYMPPSWVRAHAKDILSPRPVGTGAHDYALLSIGTALDTPLPERFPFLPIDSREAIGFSGDQVLTASYPAEFLGGLTTQSGLYPVTSIATIGQLLTIGTKTVDVVSLGGIIAAQSGSSGGPVVNQWGYIIGIITTTSEGATTAQRDLRAVTLSYIERDMQIESGQSLAVFLGHDIGELGSQFTRGLGQELLELYLPYLE